MDWLKKAPTSITITVICVCGLLALAVVAAYTMLTINGIDTTEFRQWIQTLGQLLVYPLLGTTAVASVAAARSASAAEDQTNGHLTALQEENKALRAQLEGRKADG